jgi:hypothetical protein
MTAQAVTTIAPAEPTRDPFFALVERAATDPAFDPDKIDKLLVMWERTKQSAAEAEFNDAMARAQSEMEPIRKDASNPQTHSKYASYAAIDLAVREIYTRHGFCLSFNTEDMPGVQEVRVVCLVSRGGYTRRYQVEVPTDGKGLRGNDMMTATHALASGIQYGRRYLKTMIFDLSTTETVRVDDDGNAAGGKLYMGKPNARMAGGGEEGMETEGRQRAQAFLVKSDNPVTPDSGNAHTLVLQAGENLTQWTDRYVAALGTAQTAADLAALKDGNAVLLGKVMGSTAEQAKPSQDKLRKADAEARKRVAEARPTSGAPVYGSVGAQNVSKPDMPQMDAGIDPSRPEFLPAPAGWAEGRRPTPPPAMIANPETFVLDMFARIDQCETPEAVDVIYERDVKPFDGQLLPPDKPLEGQLLPPDLEAILQRMRHRKEALTP